MPVYPDDVDVGNDSARTLVKDEALGKHEVVGIAGHEGVGSQLVTCLLRYALGVKPVDTLFERLVGRGIAERENSAHHGSEYADDDVRRDVRPRALLRPSR
ncbi:hypothetical protein [Lancefieldella rimae]